MEALAPVFQPRTATKRALRDVTNDRGTPGLVTARKPLGGLSVKKTVATPTVASQMKPLPVQPTCTPSEKAISTRKLSLFDGIEPEFATTRPPATTEDEDLDEFTKLLDLELRQSQSMNFGLIDEDGQFRLEAEAVVFHDIDAGL